ncbi:MAG TPA: GAF and ANTAR domain-containing protein, partial [Actinomycetota bacterium]|nr:GAF and ANTAR domain-containing protein [Actinomycetota bacterium]
GRDTTAAASDEYALEIDKIQYSSNEGPCVAAIDDGEIKRIEAVSEEKRWPEFCRRAEKHGFRSGLSLPLKMNGTVGALNLYALTEGAYDERSQAIAEIFARQVTIALQNAETYLATRDLADGLNTALQSRDMIGQAKGILMERENISDEEAFEMLKRISQNSNIKLRDVAQKVIDEKARS